MMLWTVQSRQFVQSALEAGVAYANWDRVEPSWVPHYLWLIGAAKRRGFCMNQPHPPIWAWHSCEGWQQAPDADDFNMLLGIDEQPHLDLVLVEIRVDPDAALLTDYTNWCEILQSSPAALPDDVPTLWYSDEAPYADQTLQACVDSLNARDIVSVADLKFSAGRWCTTRDG